MIFLAKDISADGATTAVFPQSRFRSNPRVVQAKFDAGITGGSVAIQGRNTPETDYETIHTIAFNDATKFASVIIMADMRVDVTGYTGTGNINVTLDVLDG